MLVAVYDHHLGRGNAAVLGDRGILHRRTAFERIGMRMRPDGLAANIHSTDDRTRVFWKAALWPRQDCSQSIVTSLKQGPGVALFKAAMAPSVGSRTSGLHMRLTTHPGPPTPQTLQQQLPRPCQRARR
jgi:hypothetical protein